MWSRKKKNSKRIWMLSSKKNIDIADEDEKPAKLALQGIIKEDKEEQPEKPSTHIKDVLKNNLIAADEEERSSLGTEVTSENS